MKRLKCGIITLHNISNYGATYQAFGLLNYLNTLDGLDAEFIDYSMNQSIKSSHKSSSFFVSRYISKLKKIAHWKYYLNVRKKEVAFKKFRAQYYKQSFCHYNGDIEFKRAYHDYDLMITGSDQLFNLSLTNQSEAYFLPINNGHRISYSTSFGMKGLVGENEVKSLSLLKNFNALSVRESSVAKYLYEHYNINVEVTVDPVFLLTAEDWIKYGIRLELPEKYIFCYIMSENPNAKQVIDWIKRREGHIPILLVQTCKEKLSINGKDYSGIGPEGFLSLIANCTYVVTNSFHGCALGIINGKKIFSLEEERFIGDHRYKAMLGKAGVYNKIIPYDTNWSKFDFEAHLIDGSECYVKLTPWIQESKQFLVENIKLCQG